MRLSDAIAEYQTFRTSQQYAKNTIRVERQALDLLLSEVGNIQLKSLDDRHGEAFVAALLSKGLAPGTVNLYRGAFRRFVTWCQRRKYVASTANPLGTTRNMPNHAKPRRRIPAHDFPRLLDAAEHPQERIIIALGLFLFLRASEVSDLEIGRTHLDQGFIEVYQRKTGKWDEMPICAELDVELRRWLTWLAEDQAPKRGPLQPGWPLVPARVRTQLQNDGTGKNGGFPVLPRHGQMNPPNRLQQAHNKVKKTLETFGWVVTAEDREGVHTLRRSGARAYYDALVGGDSEARDEAVSIVQSMLHHATRTQTEHYIGLEASREKRDKLLRGKPMFAQSRDNVVELRKDGVV